MPIAQLLRAIVIVIIAVVIKEAGDVELYRKNIWYAMISNMNSVP